MLTKRKSAARAPSALGDVHQGVSRCQLTRQRHVIQVSATVGARLKPLLHAYPKPAAIVILVGTNDVLGASTAKVGGLPHPFLQP